MKEEIARWQTVASEYICKNPYMRLRVDNRFAPGFGNHDFYILEFPDWVNVVAVTEDDQAVLVRQYRHGISAVSLEIPGGVVDPGEEPLTAAARELAEETGYLPKRMELLTAVRVNPAIQSNYCHLFLATGCRLLQEQALDGTEAIAVELAPLSALSGLMETGEINHSLNCLALTLALKKLSA